MYDDNDDVRARSRDAPGIAAIAAYEHCPGLLDQNSAMAVLKIFRFPRSDGRTNLETEASAV